MRNLFLLILTFALFTVANAQNDTIVDRIGGGNGGTVTWTAGTDYYLNGYVFVEDGDTLIIEPGTVIRGLETPTDASQQGSDTLADDASALIVARGGYIHAVGTKSSPIIFTTSLDTDLNSSSDVTPFENNKWGGVIILGKANLNTSPAEQQIEGIPEFEARALYGGTDDADNSGKFKWCSIRHGGSLLGANNEINGLTMGAVGSGTEIDYVEIFANQDDGIEWFGGTVNAKHLVVAFCGDDGLDYDQGYRGKNQFIFQIQLPDAGGEGGEHDGGTSPETGSPFATPTFVNATYIGRGAKRAAYFRDNAGGFYHNSIFSDFDLGVDIEIRTSRSTYSVDRVKAGELAFKNNIWHEIAQGFNGDSVFRVLPEAADTPADSVAQIDSTFAYVKNMYDNGNNVVADPAFVNIAKAVGGNLDPRATGAEVTSNLDTDVYANEAFFDSVNYKGAFNTNGGLFWLEGWTALAQYGFLKPGITSTEVVPAFEMSVYPNPTAAFVNIKADNMKAGEVSIVVYDLTGRRAAVETVNPVAGSINTTIDMSAQAAGTYYVTVQQGATVMTTSIIKK